MAIRKPVVLIGGLPQELPAADKLIGLDSVTNTTDSSKPVSTAIQAALDLKANLVSPELVTPALGTPVSGNLSNCTGFPAVSGLGIGQTWQNVKASRVSGTTYYNATILPIYVYLDLANVSHTITVGGVVISTMSSGFQSMFIVPPGASYVVTNTGFVTWAELR